MGDNKNDKCFSNIDDDIIVEFAAVRSNVSSKIACIESKKDDVGGCQKANPPINSIVNYDGNSLKKRERKAEIGAGKERKEFQKTIEKFERDVRSTYNTKCEHNLFCIISEDLDNLINGFKKSVERFFEKRNIANQLLFEEHGQVIYWRRKTLEVIVENEKLTRFEYMTLEPFFVFFLGGEAFTNLIKSHSFDGYIQNQRNGISFFSPRITVIVYGIHQVEINKIQIHFFDSLDDISVFIGQMHRSIAKRIKRSEGKQQIIGTEKGTKEEEMIISDWWSKMLKHIHRIGDDHCRTLLKHFPNPFDFMKKLNQQNASDAIKMIENIKTDRGRKIGPMLARKIYLVLTSSDGSEIIND
ncbi:unnamed protein product [Dracunculus medinensis]|uniref:Crossover junction endonuclease MUS81 n=1 Tax=Dracunculus medinensis TaxID=318479 RepID=A0A158Q4W9_DRAME|nr:unnamed protein product [Dracunculus medinensis]